MGKEEKQLSFETFGVRVGILICDFDLITHSKLGLLKQHLCFRVRDS